MILSQKTNVDDKINNLINKNNGKYITQGVSFNISCPRQMSLLRHALGDSHSFSGLVKEMLALRYTNEQPKKVSEIPQLNPRKQSENSIKKANANSWI